MSVITRRQIADLLKTIAENHYQINTFGWGDVPELLGRQNTIYPFMMVTPESPVMGEGDVTHPFRLSIADRLQKGLENIEDVDSDMYQVLRDVIAQLDNVAYQDMRVDLPVTIEPFRAEDAQDVYGFSGVINIIVDEDYDQCAVPSDDVPFDPPPTDVCLDATYIVQYENGTLIETGTIPSGGSKTIEVPDPIVCENVDWQLLDSDGNVIDSGSQPSGDPLTIIAPDGEVTVTDSDGGVLYVVNVASDGAETQAVGDATVEVENSLGVVVDSGVVKAQGSGVFNAPDATFSINSVQVRTAPSDGSASIQVRRASGSVLVGSLQGQHWRVANSTVNVNKSDATLIQAVTVAAEATGNVNVADSVVSNSDSSYSENVKATEPLSIPDVDIEVNGNKEGEIVSVKKVEVNLKDSNDDPVNPVSVDLTGNVLELEVPSGGGAFDVDLVDRFGNAFPTKQVTANATWDLRTLTPFDFADIYLNKLTNPPTGSELAAVITCFEDLFSEGIAQKAKGGFWLIIGGSSDDHPWNSRYAFDNGYSGKLLFAGSPTHNANGIETNGTSQYIRTTINPALLPINSKQMSIYSNADMAANSGVAFGSGSLNGTSHAGFGTNARVSGDNNFFSVDGARVNLNDGSYTDAKTKGLLSVRRDGATSTKYNINGVLDSSGSGAVSGVNGFELFVGASLNTTQSNTNTIGVANYKAVRCCYIYVGEALSDSQESSHYSIIHALQTALGRQA
jgi:hypothetical protein